MAENVQIMGNAMHGLRREKSGGDRNRDKAAIPNRRQCVERELQKNENKKNCLSVKNSFVGTQVEVFERKQCSSLQSARKNESLRTGARYLTEIFACCLLSRGFPVEVSGTL